MAGKDNAGEVRNKSTSPRGADSHAGLLLKNRLLYNTNITKYHVHTYPALVSGCGLAHKFSFVREDVTGNNLETLS